MGEMVGGFIEGEGVVVWLFNEEAIRVNYKIGRVVVGSGFDRVGQWWWWFLDLSLIVVVGEEHEEFDGLDL